MCVCLLQVDLPRPADFLHRSDVSGRAGDVGQVQRHHQVAGIEDGRARQRRRAARVHARPDMDAESPKDFQDPRRSEEPRGTDHGASHARLRPPCVLPRVCVAPTHFSYLANHCYYLAKCMRRWYFLPFYAILRAVPDKLGGVLLMFGAIAVLFILPWLDRSPVRSARFRPLFRIFFWLFFVNAIALGYLGGKPAEGIYVILSRVATAWYFLHFLAILPLLSMFETTKPLPKSISEPVLGSLGRAA